jgi:hypothetical protein
LRHVVLSKQRALGAAAAGAPGITTVQNGVVKRRFHLALLATLSFVAIAPYSVPGQAQRSGTTARIPTVTRLVKQFFELETTLNEKLEANDAAALDTLIDADFEARSAANPGTPIPRADWLRAASGQAHKPRIDQMAVHDFGSIAVVSFTQSTRAKAATQDSTRMIVDCWKRSGDHWLLVVRYESPSTATRPSRNDRKPMGRS